MLDYAAFIADEVPAMAGSRVVDIGSVELPTGRLLCCDPFQSTHASVVGPTLRPGAYRARLCLIDLPLWGERVALAALTLGRGRVRSWSDPLSLMVGAGLASFMDESTSGLFTYTVSQYQETGRNYYHDVLAKEFAESAAPGIRREGNWDLHTPVDGDPRNVAIFATGLGDGNYAMYWASDNSQAPVLFVVDFGLID